MSTKIWRSRPMRNQRYNVWELKKRTMANQ